MKITRIRANRRIGLAGGGAASVGAEADLEPHEIMTDCMRELQDAIDYEITAWSARLGDKVVRGSPPSHDPVDDAR